MSIRSATALDAEGCVEVLAQLPEHFTPDTHDDVRRACGAGEVLVAVAADGVTEGFAVVTKPFRRAAEISYLAVLPRCQRRGVGRALVVEVVQRLRADVAIIEVKTLDASSGYEPYVATRRFWEALGFVQVDRIDPLPGWEPGNPAAIYVKALDAT